jgi:hypothetical protein
MTSADVLARLAALHPVDRKWLLANVPNETRAQLAAALESPRVDSAGSGETPPPHGERNARYMIRNAPAADVAGVLQSEPAWITAAIMRMEEWPWSAAVLKSMPLMQRPRITLGDSHELKPALTSALLEALAKRLPARNGTSASQFGTAEFEDLVRMFEGPAA